MNALARLLKKSPAKAKRAAKKPLQTAEAKAAEECAKTGKKAPAAPDATAIAKKILAAVAPKAAPAMKPAPDKAPPKADTTEQRARRELVYCSDEDGSYWCRVNGNFKQKNSASLARHLKMSGVSDEGVVTNCAGALKTHDWVMWNAETNFSVVNVGPLAGHRVGVHINGAGQKFLVTDQAAGVFDDVSAKDADPEWFAAFLQELLPEGQWTYLAFWMGHGLKEMRAGTMGPGQAVFLVGEPRCGKSLWQEFWTEICGGRAANPLKFLSDRTAFNGDLAGAEHWMIEDPKTTFDSRSRSEFGDNIKEAAISRQFGIHRKNKQQFFVKIFRRLTVSVNWQKVALIPPMDGDFSEKSLVLKCGKVTAAFERFMEHGQRTLLAGDEQGGILDSAKMWAVFRSELPRIRSWLIRKFSTPPANLQDPRFGIEHFQHPELLVKLSELSRELHLLQLIDRLLWPKAGPGMPCDVTPWAGMALELHEKFQESNLRGAYDSICRSFEQCGSFLGKLERTMSLNRVSRPTKNDGYQGWIISPPSPPKTQ